MGKNKVIKLIDILKELVTKTEIICDKCGWRWKIADGGNDLYICHKCNHDNTPKIQK
jgi:DNA-directed RNA polymerase subunit RPC12/RpoP